MRWANAMNPSLSLARELKFGLAGVYLCESKSAFEQISPTNDPVHPSPKHSLLRSLIEHLDQQLSVPASLYVFCFGIVLNGESMFAT